MSDVAVFNLSRNTGRLAGTAEPQLSQAILGSGLLVPCPMNKMEQQPVGLCATCPHFAGIGKVEVRGEAPLLKTSRIMCSFPRDRTLQGSTAPLKDDYREYLESAIEAHAGEPGRDAKTELYIFVEQGAAVNCPISRAKTGVWRIERPPCPACDYFRGIVPGARGPICQCAHMFSISLVRMVVGSTNTLA